MVDRKRIIVGGLPGVGKTTVVAEANAELVKKGYDSTIVVLGSFMFEEAKKIGIQDRDSMRKLPIDQQRKLQLRAAQRIAEMQNEFTFVDTHFLIKTPQGYFPGLPLDVLQMLKPTQILMIEAPLKDIFARRIKDGSRKRDAESFEELEEELLFSKQFMVVAAANTGATITIVTNRDNASAVAVKDLLCHVGVQI